MNLTHKIISSIHKFLFDDPKPVERRNGRLVRVRHRGNLKNRGENRDERHSEIVDLSPKSTVPINTTPTNNTGHPNQGQSPTNDGQVPATVPPRLVTVPVPHEPPSQGPLPLNGDPRNAPAAGPPQPVTASVPCELQPQNPLPPNGYPGYGPAAAPQPSNTNPKNEPPRQDPLPPNGYGRNTPQYPASHVPRGFQTTVPYNRSGSRAYGNTPHDFARHVDFTPQANNVMIYPSGIAGHRGSYIPSRFQRIDREPDRSGEYRSRCRIASGYDARGCEGRGYDRTGYDRRGCNARGCSERRCSGRRCDSKRSDSRRYDRRPHDSRPYDDRRYDSRRRNERSCARKSPSRWERDEIKRTMKAYEQSGKTKLIEKMINMFRGSRAEETASDDVETTHESRRQRDRQQTYLRGRKDGYEYGYEPEIRGRRSRSQRYPRMRRDGYEYDHEPERRGRSWTSYSSWSWDVISGRAWKEGRSWGRWERRSKPGKMFSLGFLWYFT